MTVESEECLSEMCAMFQYMVDRGETSDVEGSNNFSTVERTRYSNITRLPHLDVVYNGRMIRLEATDLGPHVHTYEDGSCELCNYYDEDEDLDGEDDVIVVQAHKGLPQ